MIRRPPKPTMQPTRTAVVSMLDPVVAVGSDAATLTLTVTLGAYDCMFTLNAFEYVDVVSTCEMAVAEPVSVK